MFIPDPGTEIFHPGSRIRIKELKYFNPKSCRNYDPGCPDPDFIPIPNQGVKKAPDP
jgi:hypothetical protein